MLLVIYSIKQDPPLNWLPLITEYKSNRFYILYTSDTSFTMDSEDIQSLLLALPEKINAEISTPIQWIIHL